MPYRLGACALGVDRANYRPAGVGSHWMVNVPAIVYLGVWFVTQLFQGVMALSSTAAGGGIAWWAHIGGFLFGLILAYPFTIGRKPVKWYADEYWPY